jgi:membrane-bound lytic murein transglycosylase B
MFRRELEHYLLLTREEGWFPTSIKGSYAGAIGLPQFMPTSYRRYGVDFDGDGRRDLNRNVEDAIGSVANYFSVHGWERGLPVLTRAKVTREPSRHDLETRRSIVEWKSRGVAPLEDAPDDWEAMLIALRTNKGLQYWLGFKNFYVITRYNHSSNYAMAVYELSLEIQDLHRRSNPPLRVE